MRNNSNQRELNIQKLGTNNQMELFLGMPWIFALNLQKPTFQEVQFCELYEKMKLYDKALEDYNQAREKDGNCYSAYMYRRLYYQDEQMIDFALRDFNQAIEMNPKYSLAYYNRGNLYYNIDDKENALNDYNQ
ncbi:unnamed protein product [Paramecium pentaurelia]|uniref:Tetratricopeptide repeat protein n=1 Tax=Paramecium pentaurelia TaxID=43138 RepID=A0A8S1YPN5_9CILI|nr:unnamed protein product [Paramecium pentaurelia]